MKTLYLVRHAKSEWSNEHLSDVDRPLNPRGYRDAHMMGERLKTKKQLPELIIASSAIRTVSTALILSRELGYDESKIRLVPEIYRAASDEYLKAIAAMPDAVSKLMLVGHNPPVTELSNIICGNFTDSLYTCSIVSIAIPSGSWKDLSKGELVFLDYPGNTKG